MGYFPAGLVWADRATEVKGDYKRLVFSSYRALELTVERDCLPLLRKVIEAYASDVQRRRGERLQTSSCGQSVVLGHLLPGVGR